MMLAVAACACGQSQPAPSGMTPGTRAAGPQQTRSPSGSAVPGTASSGQSRTVSGPVAQETAFAGNTIVRRFALVFETGEVYVFTGLLPAFWVDEDTLLAPFYSNTADRGYHLLHLDGTDTWVNEPPPTPALPTPPPTTSADGLWRLMNAGTTAYITEVATGRRIVVPATQEYAWSPDGHFLALGGGRCGNVPVSFVDPDAATPVREVDPGGGIPRGYAWRPDASGFALATTSPNKIVFVYADDPAVRLLLPVSAPALLSEPIPGPWSPSGAYLLFGLASGRPCPD